MGRVLTALILLAFLKFVILARFLERRQAWTPRTPRISWKSRSLIEAVEADPWM